MTEPFVRVRSSVIRYENPWMRVREDDLERPDGGSGIYGIVDKKDFALVIPEQDGKFHLVEQYRFAIGRRSWEFPQGAFPPGKSGSAAELARAELVEETGMTAGTWRHLGYLHQAVGFCSQGFDIFHAIDLTPGEHAREATEADMVQAEFTEAELVRMIVSGEIVDGCTVSAFGLLRLS